MNLKIPKTIRGQSEDDLSSHSNDDTGSTSNQRRPQRTTKKPKIFSEFVTDSDNLKSSTTSSSIAISMSSHFVYSIS